MGCSSSANRRENDAMGSEPASVVASPPASERQHHTPSPSTIIRINQVRGFNRPSSPEYDRMYRIMLLGDSGVGKSSVSVAFSSNSAPGQLPATIGVDIVMKTITIDETRVCFQMFDPAGHEQNWIKMSNFGLWKTANAVLVMYDVSNPNSFASCTPWLDCVKSSVEPGTSVFLVGNKVDRTEDRLVGAKEAKEFARLNNLEYFETSASAQVGIVEMFETVGRRLLMAPYQPSQSSNT